MTKDRPREVQATHLARKAVGYVRQSTERQVLANQGSAADQRAQVRYARKWGWPDSAIEIIDDDLGLSGTSSLHRTGYQRLMAEVRANLVGAIFVSDLSRAGRDPIELLMLLDTCRIFNVLFVVDGKISDLRDSGQLFMQQIISMVAQYENSRRREIMERGKLAKVMAGHAMSRPPTGYIAERNGKWKVDPDRAVQDGIRAVFEAYLEGRSLPRAVAILQSRGVRIPRRDGLGNLRWTEPRFEVIAPILNNVVYTGDYHFLRERIDPRKGRTESGEWRRRAASPDETIVIKGHHEPYISHDEWDEIQHVMRINAPSKARRNLGPGSALLQGVIRCGRHPTRVMNPHYYLQRSDGVSAHGYSCLADCASGGKACPSVAGAFIDRAVIRAIRDRLSPPRLQMLRELFDKYKSAEEDEERRRAAEVDHARHAVDEARRRCLAVNPDHRHVAEEYEAAFEAAKEHLNRLERRTGQASSPEVPAINEGAWEEIVALCLDIEAIWNAPTTSHRDRKEIIRTLITSVIVQEQTREHIIARVVWADESPGTILDVKLVPYMHRRMLELAETGMSPAEIAAHLNEHGLRNLQGNTWSTITVRTLIGRLRRKTLRKDAA